MSNGTKKNALAAICGLLFALGLGLGGMTNPLKVQAFLDVLGKWDPSLMFVMGGGIVVGFWAFRAAKRRDHPFWGGDFGWPRSTHIDAQLLAGAAIFGVGWGLTGYCPGPALVALGAGRIGPVVAVSSMVLGMLATQAVIRRRGRTTSVAAARVT
ncbi:MAG TPA: DUF6691 family protein [Polyangia bacterium]|nr:DUF6691 family protein [Polyangia bacterium]